MLDFCKSIARMTTGGLLLFTSATAIAHADSKEVREFYINTVHVDGVTSVHGDANHDPEAFPTETLPDGRGMSLTEPDESGKWKIRSFAFVPSQMTVRKGDRVRLHFVGVQGKKHTIHVEGEGVDEALVVTRGLKRVVEFTAGEPGVVEIECYDHEPNMRAEVLILPSS